MSLEPDQEVTIATSHFRMIRIADHRSCLLVAKDLAQRQIHNPLDQQETEKLVPPALSSDEPSSLPRDLGERTSQGRNRRSSEQVQRDDSSLERWKKSGFDECAG